jgi:hypothetical protein
VNTIVVGFAGVEVSGIGENAGSGTRVEGAADLVLVLSDSAAITTTIAANMRSVHRERLTVYPSAAWKSSTSSRTSTVTEGVYGGLSGPS